MTISHVQSLAGKIPRWVKNLGYAGYSSGERASGRQRFFRNLNTDQWRNLYGSRYAYSSDFIHANPKSFSPLVKHMARAGNRTEELAEIVFRYTGCWCRTMGALRFKALRDMSGAPRFARALSKKLKTCGLTLPGGETDEVAARKIAMALYERKLLTFKGGLPSGVSRTQVQDVLQQALNLRLDASHPAIDRLRDAIASSDLTRKPAQLHWRTKFAMMAGCVGSAISYSFMYGGIAAVYTGLAATWYMKMGMMAASLYAVAFLMRSATTVVARLSGAHMGFRDLPPGQVRNYLSLFDLTGQFLRKHRNAVYQKVAHHLSDRFNCTLKPLSQLSPEQIEEEIRFSEKQSAALWKDPTLNPALRGIMLTAAALNRTTDVIFSMDRIVNQLVVSRPLKDLLFRYHGSMKMEQGKTPRCNYDYTFRKAEDTRGGRIRQAIASFIGHGGADCLGMMVGTAACSATWTAMNVASGGGMIPSITLAGGLVTSVGIGFSSVCALGWGASLAVEGVGQALLSTRSQSGYQPIRAPQPA